VIPLNIRQAPQLAVRGPVQNGPFNLIDFEADCPGGDHVAQWYAERRVAQSATWQPECGADYVIDCRVCDNPGSQVQRAGRFSR
jgi:hypothetical protein